MELEKGPRRAFRLRTLNRMDPDRYAFIPATLEVHVGSGTGFLDSLEASAPMKMTDAGRFRHSPCDESIGTLQNQGQ